MVVHSIQNLIVSSLLCGGLLFTSSSMPQVSALRGQHSTESRSVLRGLKGKGKKGKTSPTPAPAPTSPPEEWDIDDHPPYSSFPSTTISNGVIKLGVHTLGNLHDPNGSPSIPVGPGGQTTSVVGLRYITSEGETEALASGSNILEGWAVYADGDKAWSGHLDAYFRLMSPSPLVVSSDKSGAVSQVEAAKRKLKVTHDYHISPSDNLYELTITLENFSGSDLTDTRYRRLTDRRFPASPHYGCMTMQPNPNEVTSLHGATNGGFDTLDPSYPLMSFPGMGITEAPMEDIGVEGQYLASVFDFRFGALAAGGSIEFNMYLGATANHTQAQQVIEEVGAEMYAFAKSGNKATSTCNDDDTVFIIAFKDVGGNPIVFS